MMSDSSSDAFEHKMESLETSLHEDVSEEEKDDMLTRVLYGVVDTKTVTGSRVEIHQNDKMIKVQKYSRILGVGILGRDTCTFYACIFAAKAQKYKSTKSTKKIREGWALTSTMLLKMLLSFCTFESTKVQ